MSTSTSTKYTKAVALAILSLAVFLGAIHIFIGTVALTPVVSADYHRELKLTYSAFAKSLTFLHGYVDKAALASILRYSISVFQICAGIVLAANSFFPPSVAYLGNYGLLVSNLVFLLFQFYVGSSFERLAPTFVFGVLLTARLVLIEQSSKKVKPTKGKSGKALKTGSTSKKSKAE